MKIVNHDDAERSCFNCASSFVNDLDKLVCIESGEVISDENDGKDCEGWN